LRPPPSLRQNGGMGRRDNNDNVIPFRRRPRRWTRPQDFGHDPRKGPKPPKKGPPKKPKVNWQAVAAWAAITALVAATVAWHFWT